MEFATLRFAAPFLSALALATLCGHSARAQERALPEGPVKALLIEACTQCHAEGLITAQTRTSDEWTEIMGRMVGMGAPINERQQADILTYLKTHLNKAEVATAKLPAAASNKTGQTQR
jgi:hypothetical protein